ncbi:MAG: N-acetylmuramoyl-L-alanine amidase [Symploca sp. SIO1C2]|nr:N-acetylmuramoyl-L-alanine amidase [Symploca sp. SIO1C2]
MKIAIDPGHNCPPDTGASGIRQEDQLNLEVSEKVIKKLRDAGHQVINVLPDYCRSVSDSLSKRVNLANRMEVDIYVSLHFNYFNGRASGSEVFFGSQAGKAIAQKVLTKIVSLGFQNRGVKNGLHLYVIRATRMPAILIECCFCDSARDMGIYDAESMADAIVFGLIGKQTALTANLLEAPTLMEQKAAGQPRPSLQIPKG